MDPNQAFEQQVAAELRDMVGAPAHYDSLAVARSAKATKTGWSLPRPGFALGFVAAALVLVVGALALGLLGTRQADEALVVGASPSASPSAKPSADIQATSFAALGLPGTPAGSGWLIANDQNVLVVGNDGARLVDPVSGDVLAREHEDPGFFTPFSSQRSALKRMDLDRDLPGVLGLGPDPFGGSPAWVVTLDRDMWVLGTGDDGLGKAIRLIEHGPRGQPLGHTTRWAGSVDNEVWSYDGAGELARFDPAGAFDATIDVGLVESTGDCCLAGHDAVWLIRSDGTIDRFDVGSRSITASVALPGADDGPGSTVGTTGVSTDDAIWIYRDGTLYRVDPTAAEVTDAIDVGPFKRSPQMFFSDGSLWLANWWDFVAMGLDGTGLVQRVDTTSRQLVESVETTERWDALVFDDTLLVPDYLFRSGRLSRVPLDSGSTQEER